MKTLGVYKNENYNVILLSDGTKIRETNEDEFIPSFAECMDCKISDCCDGGCPFCYEGCTPSGKHGDILNYKFLDTLHPYTELALNGNDMSHPDLIPFLEKLKEKKVIANITVNQIHFERCQDMIRDLIEKKLIYGLGVSLREPTDEFISMIKQYPNAVIHVINGILSPVDVQKLADHRLKVLILGYKHLRRGESWYEKNSTEIATKQVWLYDYLPEMIEHFKVVSFDNLAIEQLDVKRIVPEEEWEEFYMGDDGKYTYFLDLVEGKFSKNSIAALNERYNILDSVDEMFEKIKLGG